MSSGAVASAAPEAVAVDENGVCVALHTATWARESHGLFDYEARHPIKKSFTVAQPTTILRKGTEVSLQSGGTGFNESEPLARLVNRNGHFCVDAARVEGRAKSGKLWRVVKELENGYQLQEGDSVKLGRFKLRVRQIVTGDPLAEINCPECANVNPPSLPPRPCNTSAENIAALDNVPCRICLLEGSSVEDPLIKPCECRGTIEYVHLACLRHWVRGKLDLAESQLGTYFYKPMACELCKTQYATHLMDEANKSNCFPLIELPKTTPPFIVLERDSNRPELKGVHVISLSEKKLLKLGRGHESDVRFADVSISRWHASVHYDQEKNAFVLTDHGSKFGTLVAMRTPVPLEQNQPLSLQAGRTVLHFALNDGAQGAQNAPAPQASWSFGAFYPQGGQKNEEQEPQSGATNVEMGGSVASSAQLPPQMYNFHPGQGMPPGAGFPLSGPAAAGFGFPGMNFAQGQQQQAQHQAMLHAMLMQQQQLAAAQQAGLAGQTGGNAPIIPHIPQMAGGPQGVPSGVQGASGQPIGISGALPSPPPGLMGMQAGSSGPGVPPPGASFGGPPGSMVPPHIMASMAGTTMAGMAQQQLRPEQLAYAAQMSGTGNDHDALLALRLSLLSHNNVDFNNPSTMGGQQGASGVALPGQQGISSSNNSTGGAPGAPGTGVGPRGTDMGGAPGGVAQSSSGGLVVGAHGSSSQQSGPQGGPPGGLMQPPPLLGGLPPQGAQVSPQQLAMLQQLAATNNSNMAGGAPPSGVQQNDPDAHMEEQ
ncbi:unnamed protein product [Amoebophrya sp. A25]|nr:unnamed protein product [Amoebophrya sp. A25]|eukprot:GSA25T00002968001.1